MAVNRKGFEFRKLLGEVSDGLGRQDVVNLKNLCYEDITERKRADIQSGVEVFNILIEKNRIGADGPEFLTELLEVLGRMDLADKVKAYSDKLERDDFQPTRVSDALSRPQLERIAVDVGRDWRMLARHLGLEEANIDSLQYQTHGDLVEASLQALLKWQQLNGAMATPRSLKSALIDTNLRGIVDKHFQ